MDQCHCHDRPIILLHCVSLSRSHSRWAYIKHILDLLTANYRDHRVKDKAVAASCQNARIKMSVNIEHFKVTSILTLIFRDKKECLKWVFAAIRKLLRWAKTCYCCEFGKIKRNLLQISPPVIEQFGQFVLSVKNRKKLDAEKLSKLELQVWTNSII